MDAHWRVRSGRAERRGREVCRRSRAAQGGGARARAEGAGTTWGTAHMAYILNNIAGRGERHGANSKKTVERQRAYDVLLCGHRRPWLEKEPIVTYIADSIDKQGRPTYNTGKGAPKAAKSQRIDSEKNDRPASRMGGDPAGGTAGRSERKRPWKHGHRVCSQRTCNDARRTARPGVFEHRKSRRQHRQAEKRPDTRQGEHGGHSAAKAKRPRPHDETNTAGRSQQK